ncbi:MAG: hypothetical protein FJ026_06625 [Chloroflexi bacterium]|nr:hypothetical protein [Chloroflexota bacterium]
MGAVIDTICVDDIEQGFGQWCQRLERRGLIGFSSVEAAELLPVQEQYLRARLEPLRFAGPITAVSLGLLYREQEVRAVPAVWTSRAPADSRWNEYARAYRTLNRELNALVLALAEQFDGVAEQATIEGWAGRVAHVSEYFSHCVSHRAFAEKAGLGWRGRHGLIVTPEAGPALRFATLFLPGTVAARNRELVGCGECQACLQVCPILRRKGDYRDACRRRINALGLESDVCGICVRVCWETVTAGYRAGQTPG